MTGDCVTQTGAVDMVDLDPEQPIKIHVMEAITIQVRLRMRSGNECEQFLFNGRLNLSGQCLACFVGQSVVALNGSSCA